jgi:Holliday junction resolvase
MKPGGGRAKGAAAEREVAAYLKERGWESRRGQQFSGGTDSPDVISDLPFHLEVKRVESGNLYNWIEQAKRDCGGKKPPVVVHRRNGKEWVAILPLDDFLRIIW